MQRRKGATGERELANIFKANGLSAHRTQQHCGAAGTSDVKCSELSDFHIECKRVEKLNIYNAYAQSERDSGGARTPIVCHRKNNTAWLVTIGLIDFMSLVLKEQIVKP